MVPLSDTLSGARRVLARRPDGYLPASGVQVARPMGADGYGALIAR